MKAPSGLCGEKDFLGFRLWLVSQWLLTAKAKEAVILIRAAHTPFLVGFLQFNIIY
jgi:hypothetical protein